MLAAAWSDITWTAIVAFIILFAFICFLAVLWSKREWNTRKIRVGMFLEREYRTDKEELIDVPPTEEDTAIIPPEGKKDAW